MPAERITDGQGPEIGAMEGWLEVFGGPPAENGPRHHGEMPGMATDARLGQLRAARGEKFDALFLTLMITHHRGAVSMATDLLSAGRNTPAEEMVNGVIAQQTAETGRMRRGQRVRLVSEGVGGRPGVHASAFVVTWRQQTFVTGTGDQTQRSPTIAAGGTHDGQHRIAPLPLGLTVRVRGDLAALTGPRPGEDGGTGTPRRRRGSGGSGRRRGLGRRRRGGGHRRVG